MNGQKTRISELVICFVLFEVGSTTLFLMGPEAKQDAWLAMLAAAAAGFVLLMLYMAIYRTDPERDLFELFRRYWGKWIGTGAGFVFVGYFAYEGSQNLRDLGEIAALILLNRTPLFILLLITVLVITNTVRLGAPVLFKFSLAIFPITLASYLILMLLLAGLGQIRIENMFPMLENGWKPILDAAFPEILSFPFGQAVLFLVFFPLVANSVRKVKKSMYIAYASIALSLTVLNQIIILVLGPGIAANCSLPLLQAVQLIEVGNVFERMDIIFVLILFIGLGTKLAAFSIGAAVGLRRLTRMNYKLASVLVGAAVYAASFHSPNYTHHIWMGKQVLYAYPIFHAAFPVLLFIVMLIRRRKAT
ncbi:MULTISPECIES: GerAB/ArcD/ProY family transporter [Cohnella]|uniref:GerAB/ArcD/ProY family transporter n=1 Tax=Cohnella TaxID=329857 RepID=UPI001FE9ADE6|nr:endospore germination permease [Cohnella massiliensis]